jgi:hypothetical protein
MLDAKERKPNTKFVLVRDRWGDLRVEQKSYIRRDGFKNLNYFDILCDTQPKPVLEKMMLMMTEET